MGGKIMIKCTTKKRAVQMCHNTETGFVDVSYGTETGCADVV
jgi:hypothetical protein